MYLFCGECRAISAYNYMQSNLAVHSKLLYHKFLSTQNPSFSTLFLSQTIPGSSVSAVQVFGNTGKKDKLLISVFDAYGELYAIFIKFKIVLCKHYEFGRV